MSDYSVETFERRGLEIKISVDSDPESPREWSNLGSMVCWHKRYFLGDTKKFGHSHIAATNDGSATFDTPDDFQEWWKVNGRGGVILPLYLYDHSGISISCGAFSCPWDSGQVGWIFVTASAIRKWYGKKRITAKMRENAERCLRMEVDIYDQYLTGQVYCYSVADPQGDGDSCCGFYGLESCRDAAIESADFIANSRDSAELIEAQYS